MKKWAKIQGISLLIILVLNFSSGVIFLKGNDSQKKEDLPEGKKSEQQKIQDQKGPQQQISDPVIIRKKKPTIRKRRLRPTRPKRAKKTKLENNFTLAVDVDLVNLDVVVTDRSGNFIPNLAVSNFKLYEDKVEQQISNFSPTVAPLTVVMLLEFTRNNAWFFWDDAQMPAFRFIQMLRPNDWAAIVSYNMKSKLLTDFTQNKQELFGAVSRMSIPNWTESNLYDALKKTLDNLDEIDGKKAVLLVSTGVDTFSKINFSTLLKRVRTTDAVIYCLGLGERSSFYGETYMGSRLDYLQAQNNLKTFAKSTGGKAWFPRFPQEHYGILQQIGIELRNQYSLGYLSTNLKQDGKFRKIKVQVVDKNGKKVKRVKARARAGYRKTKG